MSAINLEQFQKVTEDQYDVLLRKGQLEIEFTCAMVNFAQEPLDVASDYLQALYIGEQLAQYSTSISVEEIEKEGMHPSRFVRYTITPSDKRKLYVELVQLSKYVADETSDDYYWDYTEILEDYKDKLVARDQASISFQEILEVYREYVNMHVEDD